MERLLWIETMALQYSTFQCVSTSEALDVPEEKLGRLRQVKAAMVSKSLSSAALLGRNRHPRIQKAVGVSKGAIAAIRKRGSSFLMASETTASAVKLTSMPPVPRVSGEVRLEGELFKNRRLPKGRSHTIAFVATGKKMQHLSAFFELQSLAGTPILAKQVELNPGGVAFDDFIVNGEGYQTIVGYIFLLPSETELAQFGREVELKYSLTIGNKTTRSHLVEAGFITFYKT